MIGTVLYFLYNFCIHLSHNSRLYWYRGVTVLLPGWGYLEVMWFVHANLPIGRCTSVRTVDPHGENGSKPLLTLTLTTITSMQIQNKQASTPHHVHSTMQPPSKITVCKMYSCQYQPLKIINQKEWHMLPNMTFPTMIFKRNSDMGRIFVRAACKLP
jgi:hypothetical protein